MPWRGRQPWRAGDSKPGLAQRTDAGIALPVVDEKQKVHER